MRKSSLLTLAGVLAIGASGMSAIGDVTVVEIEDFEFISQDIGIVTGDTVRWEWIGAIPHSSTSAAGFAESWDSGVQTTGFSFEHDFTFAGIYPYYCTLHGSDNGDGTVGGMSGYVSVFSGTDFELLGPTPGGVGMDNQFAAGGATPGSTVHFVYAFSSGSTNVPGCPGLTLDLRSPQLFASVPSDADGFARLEVFIPSAASGHVIFFQAVEVDGCQVSNQVVVEF